MLAVILFLACGGAGDTGAGVTADFALTVTNTSLPGALVASDGSTHDIKLAPGVAIVHDPGWTLFDEGTAASAALEQLAEDGDPAALLAALEADDAVHFADVIAAKDGTTYDDAPVLPGEVAVRSFTASTGDVLTFAQMYGESNDVFVATAAPVALFDATGPVTADITAALALFDAGTELNQEPGLGEDQAPRQAEAGQGDAEGGVITELSGTDAAGWSYPDVPTFVQLQLDGSVQEELLQ